MKAPNLVKLVTVPSMTDPEANFCVASAKGSVSNCLKPSEIRRSSSFMPRMTASTVSPILKMSCGFRTFLAHDISER